MKPDQAALQLLTSVGYDVASEHMARTPQRWAEVLVEYSPQPEILLKEILEVQFNSKHDNMVALVDFAFYSLCAHHMLPFFGVAHVAYIPDGGKIVGLSKLGRLVEFWSKRPTVQEDITNQVVDSLMEHLAPKGAMCVLDAGHLCMRMRGVRSNAESTVVTSAVRGVFLDNKLQSRDEFLALIRSKR